MELREFIAKTIHEYLNESYKLTFDDKKRIESNIRNNYNNYKNDIEKHNHEIEWAKNFIENSKKSVDKGDFTKEQVEAIINGLNLENISKKDKLKPILFNKFYKDNIDYVIKDYVNYKQRNAPTNFIYKSKKEKNIKNKDYEKFYNALTNDEKRTIKNFLNIVSERINSGIGESVDRKHVRDSFFKTPIKFQKMFSEKPSPYLWRGDYTHPCSEDYDHDDINYLSMQSFSIFKRTAQEFGQHFNSTNIKSYGGSFSLPLYTEYGGDVYDLGDDEGEVMFFDVTYKCKK